jgi:putative transcriptional regulator
MPHMQDLTFRQSLIYVLDHGAHGAWGVIINQPMGMELDDIFQQLDIESASAATRAEPVLCGGPVDQQHGLVLHPSGQQFESTREFTGGVSLSSSRDVLEALARGDEPTDHLVLLGHSGWAPGQLELEMADNAWLSCEADVDVIFNTPLADKRAAVSGLLGFELHSVVGESGHA